MPIFERIANSGSPTPTYAVFAESSSEAAALHGQKALTPIIAGTISGTCVGVAWTIAAFVAIMKRYRKRKHYKKMGKPDPVEEAQKGHAPFILPPDPAVIEGHCQPGEHIVVEKKDKKHKKGKEKGGEFPHGSVEKDSYSLREFATGESNARAQSSDSAALPTIDGLPSTRSAVDTIGNATTIFNSQRAFKDEEHVKEDDYGTDETYAGQGHRRSRSTH